MPLPSQHLSRLGRQRYFSRTTVLGERQVGNTPIQIDRLPTKSKCFASSHPCLNGEGDEGPDVWFLGLLGCFFQLFELAIFQSPVPRW